MKKTKAQLIAAKRKIKKLFPQLGQFSCWYPSGTIGEVYSCQLYVGKGKNKEHFGHIYYADLENNVLVN